MFHDHVEKSFTTNGMGEGGSISLIAYNNYIDENGTPKAHGMDLKPYFTREFWERKIPVWQDWADDWGSLGAPAGTMETRPAASNAAAAANPADPTGRAAATASNISQGDSDGPGLLAGLLLGIAAFFLYQNREKVLALIKQLPFFNQSKS